MKHNLKAVKMKKSSCLCRMVNLWCTLQPVRVSLTVWKFSQNWKMLWSCYKWKTKWMLINNKLLESVFLVNIIMLLRQFYFFCKYLYFLDVWAKNALQHLIVLTVLKSLILKASFHKINSHEINCHEINSHKINLSRDQLHFYFKNNINERLHRHMY